MKNIFKKIGLFFLDIIEVAVIAMAIFVIVYLFLFQPHQVKGSSMFPNFENKEYILTDKLTYRFRPPHQGDVVIFKAPVNEDLEYIKRVIAIPGEKIMIQNGKVYINNQEFHEDYLPGGTYTMSGNYLTEGMQILLEENQYLVMGDNRSHSSDSRDWGLVPLENIVGKAWLRYWPVDRIGLIED